MNNERHEQLSQWLYRLVEILRQQGGITWDTLGITVSGKTAIIDLDGTQLRLHAQDKKPLRVEIDPQAEPHSVDFRSEAETIRDIMSGRLTVDSAVANDKIYLRGNLQELLGIYKVVMGILADSAINPQLQRLWEEFDQTWSRPSSAPPLLSLEQQKASYGELIRQIPEDVLRIQIEP